MKNTPCSAWWLTYHVAASPPDRIAVAAASPGSPAVVHRLLRVLGISERVAQIAKRLRKVMAG